MSHRELSAELFTPGTLHAHAEMNKRIYKYYLAEISEQEKHLPKDKTAIIV